MSYRLSGLLFSLMGSSVIAATNYVVVPGTPGVSPAPNYLTWETAATNIQDAVSAASSGNVVLVKSGTYVLTNTVTITNAIILLSYHSNDSGARDRAGTIIDGNYPAWTNRCLLVSNVLATVDGFTITNGFAPAGVLGGNGGGIYLSKGTITNCDIVGNMATTNGGGVYINATGTVAGSSISGNQTITNAAVWRGSGGGICMVSGGIVTNCTITSNSAYWGGGISMHNNGPVVRDCVVMYNEAKVAPSQGASGASGGGIYQNGAQSTTWGCTIFYNTSYSSTGGSGSSGSAGGINLAGGLLVDSVVASNNTRVLASGNLGGYGGGIQVGTAGVASNCVIRQNGTGSGVGTISGAGLYSANINALLVNCTFVGNKGSEFMQGGTLRNCLLYGGGGVNSWSITNVLQNCTIVSNTGGVGVNTARTVLDNCIVYYNGTTGTNYSNATGTLVWTNSCTLPAPAGVADTGNTTLPPAFKDLAGGNFRLSTSSPCIDQGVTRSWMTGHTDLDGQRRVNGSAVDMGAYEYIRRSTTFMVQ